MEKHLRELREGFRILGSKKFWADFVAYYKRLFMRLRTEIYAAEAARKYGPEIERRRLAAEELASQRRWLEIAALETDSGQRESALRKADEHGALAAALIPSDLADAERG